jgi:hypothetical protein
LSRRFVFVSFCLVTLSRRFVLVSFCSRLVLSRRFAPSFCLVALSLYLPSSGRCFAFVRPPFCLVLTSLVWIQCCLWQAVVLPPLGRRISFSLSLLFCYLDRIVVSVVSVISVVPPTHPTRFQSPQRGGSRGGGLSARGRAWGGGRG